MSAPGSVENEVVGEAVRIWLDAAALAGADGLDDARLARRLRSAGASGLAFLIDCGGERRFGAATMAGPALWIDGDWRAGAPTLAGADLLAVVRSVFGLAGPGPGGEAMNPVPDAPPAVAATQPESGEPAEAPSPTTVAPSVEPPLAPVPTLERATERDDADWMAMGVYRQYHCPAAAPPPLIEGLLARGDWKPDDVAEVVAAGIGWSPKKAKDWLPGLQPVPDGYILHLPGWNGGVPEGFRQIGLTELRALNQASAAVARARWEAKHGVAAHAAAAPPEPATPGLLPALLAGVAVAPATAVAPPQRRVKPRLRAEPEAAGMTQQKLPFLL